MDTPRSTVADVIRFGPFQANPRTRELWKDGRRVRLPGLPFEVLLALLERPADLVTREELQRRLWVEGTFVDFDNNLNAAVTRLRQALGDSAEQSQYIETLPRLGYRFIAPLAPASPATRPASEAEPVAALADAAPTVARTADEGGTASPASRPTGNRTPTRSRALGAVLVASALVLAAVAWRTWPLAGNQPQGRLMLVVLPFDNLTGDPDQQHVSDGITEEMITELARLDPARLNVIARTTAFKYKGTAKTVAEIALELKADFVVEGSVRRDGDRVRVTAQLIEPGNQSHLWAESYDRDLRGLLDVERDVARAVASAVRVAVVPRDAAARDQPVSADARDAYLRARFFASQGTVFAVEKALEFYRTAIALEPGYALAHAGQARALVFATRTEPGQALRQARAAAAEARRLAPTLPEAQLAWAVAVLYGDRDLAAAGDAFSAALALDRGNAEAHYYSSQYLTAAGRFDEALQAAREAQALDPFSPLIHHYVGRILHFAGRNTEAIQHLAQTLDLEPNYSWALLFTANAHEDLGTYAEATAFRQKYWAAMGVPPDKISRLGEAFATAGYPAVRREWIDWIEGFARSSGYVTSTELAMLYGWLGEKEQAFKWLEKAVTDQTRDLIYLRVTPELAPLRSDPRFDAIAARVFPQIGPARRSTN